MAPFDDSIRVLAGKPLTAVTVIDSVDVPTLNDMFTVSAWSAWSTVPACVSDAMPGALATRVYVEGRIDGKT